MKTVAFLWALLCPLSYILAQTHSQTIRGQIVDRESMVPLVGASVLVLDSDPVLGGSTDADGTFRIENVPIGRQSLQVTYLGYETQVLPFMLVTTGKEVVLDLELTESVVAMEEIVVKASDGKSQPLNEMAIASARSFSVEETGRYASSLFDPARMAQNFAGVSTTGGSSDLFNEIIVRGNSPRGVLWRLEGIEIPNPNHFGALGNTGGGISMLSSGLLSRSDFYTGAFPAEFGNATSGAFDLNLRKGNNQKREHAFMLGILGTEVSSEGPIGPTGGASYLVNFRYSTLSLLQQIGLNPVGDVLPEYGDLSFNINLPSKSMGQFNVFGLFGKNRAYEEPVADSIAWEMGEERYGFNERAFVGTLGLSHRLLLSNDSYLHTVIAGSIHNTDDDDYYLDPRNDYAPVTDLVNVFNNNYLRLRTTYHKKIDARNSLKIGGEGSHHGFDFFSREWEVADNQFFTYLQDTGSARQYQLFSQWKHRVSEKWTITAGLHFNYFELTKHSSIEPRLASRWTLSDKQSLHLALGLHSKPEHPVFYFIETSADDQKRTLPNRNLDYTKSFHAVAGYDHQFSKNFRMKVELYYQHLYDIPVENERGGLKSMVNVLDFWDMLDAGAGVAEGRGRNYGLDLTLEKNFSRSYYFLWTGSLFDSKFRNLEGEWFNTRFNSRYQSNLLAGKEFTKGRQKNKILGINGKVVLNGGNRTTPFDMAKSSELGYGVRDNSRFLSESIGAYYRLDVGVSYKINRKKMTHAIMLDIQNITNRLNPLEDYYIRSQQKVGVDTHTGLFPVLNYRVEF